VTIKRSDIHIAKVIRKMPIHVRLDKINCCIVQKRVSDRTKVIQEVRGEKKKKNFCIINLSTNTLQFYGNVLIIAQVL